jgi:DNA uptake protein ComE-like DNA-binding protein
MKPMTIILIGAIIAIIGGIISAIGTWQHNKNSSEKTTRIESGVNMGIDIGKTTNAEVNNLKKQNSSLIHQSDLHNEKIDSQSKIIDALRNENADLYTKLANSSLDIYHNLTGGDGFCILSIIFENEKLSSGTILIKGDKSNKSPIRNVEARIVDENTIDTNIASLGNFSTIMETFTKNTIKIEVLEPNFTVITNNKILLDKVKGVNLNVFFTANSGSFKQLIRMKFIGGKWISATVIDRNDKVIFKKIDETYPKNDLPEIFKK